jgi:hypothetical protein
MPADVSFDHVSPHTFDQVGVRTAPAETSRLPLGIGLAVAACASVGLWLGVAAGIRAIFF